MDYEEQLAIEESAYWFCLNDVADYVSMYGSTKVLKDLLEIVDSRQKKERCPSHEIDFSDVPF